MIDYYETKTHPITKRMVLDAYKHVRDNGGSAGIDGESISDYAESLPGNLYKLWNRMTSGSYLPSLVKEVKIPKKSGGFRSLGIPTVEDRVAQQVVKSYLEPKIDESFHPSSFGYRKGRNAHQALAQAHKWCKHLAWVIDLDIKGFFDNIDHELMMKAVKYYTQEKWVLLYVERWLKAGVMKDTGGESRDKGTPQGGVISPLLSNIFLHFTFDKWMEKNFPYIKFERYCDDIIVHCASIKQAEFLKQRISQRLTECKLELNAGKTQIVYCPKGQRRERHDQTSFDFLGYTFKPRWINHEQGGELVFTPCMSSVSKKSVKESVRNMQFKRKKIPIQRMAVLLNPKLRGWIEYYCKWNKWTTTGLWWWMNNRLMRWVMKSRLFSKKRAYRWLQGIYKTQPRLFVHWQLLKP
jgi:RNA-directed DNA polymerase